MMDVRLGELVEAKQIDLAPTAHANTDVKSIQLPFFTFYHQPLTKKAENITLWKNLKNVGSWNLSVENS